jgi:uncharacterized protein
MKRFLLLFVLVGLIGVCFGYRNAITDPIVRRASIRLPEWPQGVSPITVLLLSDTHASRPDMTPARLSRIVRQLNALHPDMMVIAGDFVSDKFFALEVETNESLAPLGALRAPLGVHVVLGNHDHWRGVGRVRRAMRRAHLDLIKDDAERIGPLIVGGIDDSVTDNADFEGTIAKMDALGTGPKILLSHGTSHFAFLPPNVTLMLTGHTHCGQIEFWLPFREKYHCGVERGRGKTLVTTAGLGTSIIPVRFNAPPDVWLLTLGG